MINLRARQVAMTQRTLNVHDQDITTVDAIAIRLEFPSLTVLDIQGSTLNGEQGIEDGEVAALSEILPSVTITGLAPIEARLASVEGEIQSLQSLFPLLQRLQEHREVVRQSERDALERGFVPIAEVDGEQAAGQQAVDWEKSEIARLNRRVAALQTRAAALSRQHRLLEAPLLDALLSASNMVKG
jgi:ubiquinone biosynthesis protein UbiJ